MKINKIYCPALGGSCIGIGVGLLTSNMIIAGISAALITAGILFLIYGFK